MAQGEKERERDEVRSKEEGREKRVHLEIYKETQRKEEKNRIESKSFSLDYLYIAYESDISAK